jgi:tetratricopeptide (TPR) repeat protein
MALKIPDYKFELKASSFQKDDTEFMVWFLEGVLENYPDYIECLMYLGNAYTAMGKYEEGLQIDLRLKKLRRKSIELGYDDVQHIEDDADLDRLRDEEGYSILVNKLKEIAERRVQ